MAGAANGPGHANPKAHGCCMRKPLGCPPVRRLQPLAARFSWQARMNANLDAVHQYQLRGRKRTPATVVRATTNAGLRRHLPVVLLAATMRLSLLSCCGGTKLAGVGPAEGRRRSDLERVLQAFLQYRFLLLERGAESTRLGCDCHCGVIPLVPCSKVLRDYPRTGLELGLVNRYPLPTRSGHSRRHPASLKTHAVVRPPPARACPRCSPASMHAPRASRCRGRGRSASTRIRRSLG